MPDAKKVVRPVSSKITQISGRQLVTPHQALALRPIDDCRDYVAGSCCGTKVEN
jgi:hypothetical protein